DVRNAIVNRSSVSRWQFAVGQPFQAGEPGPPGLLPFERCGHADLPRVVLVGDAIVKGVVVEPLYGGAFVTVAAPAELDYAVAMAPTAFVLIVLDACRVERLLAIGSVGAEVVNDV